MILCERVSSGSELNQRFTYCQRCRCPTLRGPPDTEAQKREREGLRRVGHPMPLDKVWRNCRDRWSTSTCSGSTSARCEARSCNKV